MGSIFEIIISNQSAFLEGLITTLKMCGIVWGAGLFVGAFLAITAYKFRHPFYYVFSAIFFLIISIPILVILYWFHYPFQSLIGMNIDPFITATTTLTIVNSLLIYQVLVTSLNAFPKQYIDVAKVSGLSDLNALLRIQFPILLRQFIPTYLVVQVFMLQTSIFASNISVQEIFRKALQVNSMLKQPIEIFSAMAIFFVAICVPLYVLAYFLWKRFSRDISEG